MEILSFTVGMERYGLALEHVLEVLRAVAVTPLPGAPAQVDGVVNVRGSVIPVLNLAGRLGLAVRSITPAEHLIRVQAGARTLLLRVDQPGDLSRLDDESTQRVDDVIACGGSIAGIATLPDGLMLIHDPETFLTAAESDQLESALARSSGAAGEAEP